MIISSKKKSNLVFFENDDGCFSIFNSETHREIIMSDVEFSILKMLDGKCTSELIIERYPEFDDLKILRLITLFQEKKLLESAEKNRIVSRITFDKIKKITVLSIPCIDYNYIKNFKCNRIVPVIFYLFLFLGLVGILDFGLNLYQDYYLKYIFECNIVDIALYCLIVIISITLHEFGHAFMITYSGAFVIRFDIGFNLFLPCARTVYIGNRNIKLKRDKILITMYGIVVNLFLAFISIAFFKICFSKYLLFSVFFNYLLAIFNMIIFFDTDGLQLLKCLIGAGNKDLFRTYYIIIYLLSILCFYICVF